ncbi:hypothetical protein Fmac_032237 [Flemingia macrophylla]|uniref:Uncharacterized protein n=1 Tax=Flemingia macrophylla TaxID=520843 RepID=A0ABD1L4E3_9FABA
MLRLAWKDANTYDDKINIGELNGSIRNKEECSSSSNGKRNKWFIFLSSRASYEAWANIKATLLVIVVFLAFYSLIVTLNFANEVPLATASHHRHSDEPNGKVNENHIEKDIDTKHFKAFSFYCAFSPTWNGSHLVVMVSLLYVGYGLGVSEATKIVSLVVFLLLGFSVVITYSVPFTITTELTFDSDKINGKKKENFVLGGGSGLLALRHNGRIMFCLIIFPTIVLKVLDTLTSSKELIGLLKNVDSLFHSIQAELSKSI